MHLNKSLLFAAAAVAPVLAAPDINVYFVRMKMGRGWLDDEPAKG